MATIEQYLYEHIRIMNNYIERSHFYLEKLWEILIIRERCANDFEMLIDLENDRNRLQCELAKLFEETEVKLSGIRRRMSFLWKYRIQTETDQSLIFSSS